MACRWDVVFWIQDGVVYKAIYYSISEKYIIREAESFNIILVKTGVSLFEWNIFKLGVLKWKNVPVQDVDKKFQ